LSIVKSDHRECIEDFAAGKLYTTAFQVSDNVEICYDFSIRADDKAAAKHGPICRCAFDEDNRWRNFRYDGGAIKRRLSVSNDNGGECSVKRPWLCHLCGL